MQGMVQVVFAHLVDVNPINNATKYMTKMKVKVFYYDQIKFKLDSVK